MKQSSKFLIVVGCGIAGLLAALPAFAMHTESSALPSSTTSARETQAAQSAAPQAAASEPPAAQSAAPVAAAQAAPQVTAQAATVSVDAGPAARIRAQQIQPAAASQQPEPAAQVNVAPADTSALAAPPEDTSAIKIAAPPAPASGGGGEVEFIGKIDGMSGILPTLVLTVSTHLVRTDAQTDISGTLAVGVMVEVKGSVQSDGSILASRIRVENGPENEGEVEFRGPIQSLPGNPDLLGNWVVGDFTVTVDVSTTIIPTRTAAVVGAIAEVKAARQLDGTLLARQIHVEDAAEFENEAEFKGVVSNLTGSAPTFTMMVNTITVTTNSLTQISGTLANGVIVEVHGSTQPDGSVLATQIKVEQPEAEPAELEFTAHISGTLPAGLLGTWTFDNGKSVTVDAHTLIDQSHGLVAPGVLVQVQAVKQPDNSYLAVRIKVEND